MQLKYLNAMITLTVPTLKARIIAFVKLVLPEIGRLVQVSIENIICSIMAALLQ